MAIEGESCPPPSPSCTIIDMSAVSATVINIDVDSQVVCDTKRHEPYHCSHDSEQPQHEEKYQSISYVRLDPPLLIPVKSIIRQKSSSKHETHPKSVRFTLDANYFIYEKQAVPRDEQTIRANVSISKKSGKRRRRQRIQRIRSSSNATVFRKRSQLSVKHKKKSPKCPHPSKIILALVCIALIIICLTAKRKKKDAHDPLELLLAFL